VCVGCAWVCVSAGVCVCVVCVCVVCGVCVCAVLCVCCLCVVWCVLCLHREQTPGETRNLYSLAKRSWFLVCRDMHILIRG